MKAWSNYFYGQFGASRAYLLSRALLIMLALDMWSLMIGHAGRYGIDGFNVAHFAWLDRLQPLPNAASYIAVLLLSGMLALTLAFTNLRRIPALLLLSLYTFSWSMSMLDSYQHHYFVSLLLLCLAFFPETPAQQVHPPAPEQHPRAELYGWLYVASMAVIVAVYAAFAASAHPFIAFAGFAAALALATWFYSPTPRAPTLTTGWGYPLLGVSVAIVYGFTSLAKVDAQWLAGHTLLRISEAEQVFAPLADLGVKLGIPRERVWAWISTLVIPQEAALGLCYLVASTQDRARSRWPAVASALGFALAVLLHVGAEAMELQIGWFSYYMLLLAACYLLPLPIVDRFATLFTWPASHLERWTASRLAGANANNTTVRIAGTCASCGVLALCATQLGLPGAWAACALCAGAVLTLNLRALIDGDARAPLQISAATALAASCMWLTIAQGEARWDFYRYLGGDLKRRGELSQALWAYEKGEAYAPPGESRAKQIAELRRTLAQPAKPKPSAQ